MIEEIIPNVESRFSYKLTKSASDKVNRAALFLRLQEQVGNVKNANCDACSSASVSNISAPCGNRLIVLCSVQR